MILVNLDKEFRPFGKGISFESFEFPSGIEPHIKFGSKLNGEKVRIVARIKNGNDLLTIFLANDALKRIGFKEIELFISYLPFARQDRVMVKGEPLSLKVITDLINLQNFSKVQVYDPHSSVTSALINNIEPISNIDLVTKVVKFEKDCVLVSPDAGSQKNVLEISRRLKKELVLCNKIRNVNTGWIERIDVSSGNLKGKHAYIIDDICDGGATFILLAQALKERGCKTVNLIVSHGIFSKGIEVMTNIDHIYTTNSFKDLKDTKKLTQIKLRWSEK